MLVAQYVNRQGNTVSIHEDDHVVSVEVKGEYGSRATSLRALSAQCRAARQQYEKASGTSRSALVSQGGFCGATTTSLNNVYA